MACGACDPQNCGGEWNEEFDLTIGKARYYNTKSKGRFGYRGIICNCKDCGARNIIVKYSELVQRDGYSEYVTVDGGDWVLPKGYDIESDRALTEFILESDLGKQIQETYGKLEME